MGVLVAVIMFVLSGVAYGQDTYVPAACTHYATNNGSTSNSCPYTAPCTIQRFWSIVVPGNTLCLFNGTYSGSANRIQPPAGVAGTPGNPITIRALNDGQVLISGSNTTPALWLRSANGNNWFVIEGLNFTSGLEANVIFGGADNIARRSVSFNGTSDDQNSFAFTNGGLRNMVEDCAGWGNNMRKIFNGSQSGNVQGSGFRRCWGEWNDATQWTGGFSTPTNTYQMGYGTVNQLFENVLGTWNLVSGGQSTEPEGVVRIFRGGGVPPFDMVGTKILGSIFYTTAGRSFQPNKIFTSDEVANLLVQDVVAFVDSTRPTVHPFYHYNCPVSGECFGNVCQNCLAVHAGQSNFTGSTSGWTTPNLKVGNGLAAATGGTSAFLLLPGICKRYVDGVLTDIPLWPWPMSLRVKEARIATGFSSVDVTDEIVSILGSIPSECIATSDRANVGGRWIPSTFEPIMGPVLVWPTRQKARVSLDVAQHTNTAVSLVLTLEASYDNGVSWKFISSTTRKGGTAVDDVGAAETDVYVAGEIGPEVGGVKRRVRGRVTLPSGGFDTGGGFVEASN